MKDEYRIGRSPTCDLTLGDELGQKINGFISKEHFVLKRVSVSPLNENDYAVHIIDTSFNGTFVNGKKLKRGNCAVLENNDEISLAFKDFIGMIFEIWFFKKIGLILKKNCYHESIPHCMSYFFF